MNIKKNVNNFGAYVKNVMEYLKGIKTYSLL